MNIYRYISYMCIFFLVCSSLFFFLKSIKHDSNQIHAPVVATVPEPKVPVLVASRAIHAGSVLASNDMSEVLTPKSFLFPGVIPATDEAKKNLVGTLLRVSIQKGAQFRLDDVVHPGDGGFLAALLSPGLLGVSISIDPASSPVGLIWPGDYVDVIFARGSAGDGVPGANGPDARVILNKVRVVAVDQQLVRGKNPDSNNQSNHDVVVEVTSAQAKKIAVAQKIGRLNVALCPTAPAEQSHDASSSMPEDDVIEAQIHSEPDVMQSTPPKPAVHSIRVFNGLTESVDGK